MLDCGKKEHDKIWEALRYRVRGQYLERFSVECREIQTSRDTKVLEKKKEEEVEVADVKENRQSFRKVALVKCKKTTLSPSLPHCLFICSYLQTTETTLEALSLYFSLSMNPVFLEGSVAPSFVEPLFPFLAFLRMQLSFRVPTSHLSFVIGSVFVFHPI